MVHWIDNIAFGVDFRKNRKQKPETLEQMAMQISMESICLTWRLAR